MVHWYFTRPSKFDKPLNYRLACLFADDKKPYQSL